MSSYFLQQEFTWVAQSLTSKWNSTSAKGSVGIDILNQKRTWKKLLMVAHAIVTVESHADISVISSRNTGKWAVLKFSAATGIQAAFQKPCLLAVSDPSLLQRHLTLTCLPLLWVTQILLCAMCTLPSHTTIREASHKI
ncbi:40S ribosomal protein SA [Plecturocebus cupreus]